MEFRILGSLEVWEGGRALPIAGGKAKALLAILLLHANEVVATDRLIDELWGEDVPETASGALYVHVSELRKALGGGRAGRTAPDVLLTRRPGYVLRVEPSQLDLERFQQLVAKGRKALDQGLPELASATLENALALWRGPALADVRGESFAVIEAARLEELRVGALENRIEADLALGRHAEVVPEIEKLVDEHPFREHLRAQLILALYRSGRQAEALQAYRETRAALVERLGLDPSPELQELERAVLAQDPALVWAPRSATATCTPPSNLRTPVTPLIGRRKELAEVSELLGRDDVRLLTLTGAPGSGKTRLALQLAADVLEQFRDGVFFVELESLSEPDLVASATAQALAEELTAETVVGFVAEKTLLLVLDNFEHVLPAAPFLSELLLVAPGLKLVVTSRASLHLSGEQDYPVPPLELPDLARLPEIDALAGIEAVALFVARARAALPDFDLTEGNAGAIAEICVRLDGLPLALELAAARIGILSPPALLARLGQPLELLKGGARDLPSRQRSLTATITWSHGLLAEQSQLLFRRVSVFSGGFTLDAAEAVCMLPDEAELDVLDGLAGLVDNNLLQRDMNRAEETRFSMLTTIREYADEQLETGERETMRRRHAEYFLNFAERAQPELNGDRQTVWLERLDAELDNVRAALRWSGSSVDRDLQLRLAGALGRFWTIRGYLTEGRRWLEAGLTRSSATSPLRARALRHASHLALLQADYEPAKAFAEESLALCRSHRDSQDIVDSLSNLATVLASTGDIQQAHRLFEKSAAIARANADKSGLSTAIANQAALLLEHGDYGRATTLLHESLALDRELGDEARLVHSLFFVGVAFLHQHRYEDASRSIAEGLALSERLQFREGIIYCLNGMAAICAARREAQRAATLLGAAHALHDAVGISLGHAEDEIRERARASAREQLGSNDFSIAWGRGRAMNADQAIADALGATREPGSRTMTLGASGR